MWPKFYDDVASGAKPFEVRIDDRLPKYETGDTLILAEWDCNKQKYTGRKCEKKSTYVLRDTRFGKEGYCVIGLEGIRAKSEPRALTVEELRERVGKPVWVETMNEWRIIIMSHDGKNVNLYNA